MDEAISRLRKACGEGFHVKRVAGVARRKRREEERNALPPPRNFGRRETESAGPWKGGREASGFSFVGFSTDRPTARPSATFFLPQGPL